jgi:NADP-dependent 3-hydroxy acid dehydrogenase YdfG
MENDNAMALEPVKGKSILITGGTTGIGRSTALLLASMGANVMIVGTDQHHLEKALEDIKKTALGEVSGMLADLATEDGIQSVFTQADSSLKGLDVLINNAALAFGSITEGDYQDWTKIVNTNLLGYLACANEAITRMKAAGWGHIVNIGSMSADVREEKSSVYVATKSAVQGFSASLRKQVNTEGIKITLIEPGAVDTDMQPEDTQAKKEHVKDMEMLSADDIAAAVYYCLSQPKRCDVVELKIRPHHQLI